MKTNNITYRRVGDYNIPNLILPPEKANIRLGKWGSLHKSYLQQHKRVFYNTLVSNLTLHSHLADIDEQARSIFETLVEQMKQAEGITEQLKEENQIEWVRCVQNIESRSKLIVNNEIIFN